MPAGQDQQELRPSRLWKRMPEQMRLEAALSLWADEESAEQQVEAVTAIVRHMKFRPKTAQALSAEKKARYVASMPNPPETLVARMLITYHLQHQRPMMSAFLDALGISHENGLITAEEVRAPDPSRLAGAARDLAVTYPEPEVRLYFATLQLQDPETWGALADVDLQRPGTRAGAGGTREVDRRRHTGREE